MAPSIWQHWQWYQSAAPVHRRLQRLAEVPLPVIDQAVPLPLVTGLAITGDERHIIPRLIRLASCAITENLKLYSNKVYQDLGCTVAQLAVEIEHLLMPMLHGLDERHRSNSMGDGPGCPLHVRSAHACRKRFQQSLRGLTTAMGVMLRDFVDLRRSISLTDRVMQLTAQRHYCHIPASHNDPLVLLCLLVAACAPPTSSPPLGQSAPPSHWHCPILGPGDMGSQLAVGTANHDAGAAT